MRDMTDTLAGTEQRRAPPAQSLLGTMALSLAGIWTRISKPLTRGRHSDYPPPSKTEQTIAMLLLAANLTAAAILIGGTIINTRLGNEIEQRQAAAEPNRMALTMARQDELRRNALRPIAAYPTVSNTLNAILTSLPPETRIHSLSHDRQGRIEIEIDTTDPDRLRPMLRDTPYLRRFREIRQSRIDDFEWRLILQSGPRGTDRSS